MVVILMVRAFNSQATKAAPRAHIKTEFIHALSIHSSMCIHTRVRDDRNVHAARVAPPGKEQMGPGQIHVGMHVSTRAVPARVLGIMWEDPT